MAFTVPTICSKCGKKTKSKGGVVSMHLTPKPLCYDCKPLPPAVETVEVPRREWDAMVRFLREEEKVYRDSYNTPGKNDWETYFRENHPEDYKIFDAARQAASRKF